MVLHTTMSDQDQQAGYLAVASSTGDCGNDFLAIATTAARILEHEMRKVKRECCQKMAGQFGRALTLITAAVT